VTITAIIPTCNRAETLSRAIRSVLAQTRPVDEILVVDDGSPDGGRTRSVVEQFAPAVRYVRQDNRGVATARNTGAREARSEWLAFLDDDDEWLPGKIEAQLDALGQTPYAELCYTGLRTLSPDGVVMNWDAVPTEKLWPMVRYRCPFSPITMLVRRDSFLASGGFNEELRYAEDWEFAIRFLPGRRTAVALPPFVLVHTHVTSTSSQVDKMFATEVSLLDTMLTGLRGPSRWLWRLRIVSRIHYRAALGVRRHKGNFWPHLLRSMALWPSPCFESQRYRTIAVELLAALRQRIPA
jgi:glycosyltransferase involved in cell wall biosynthesis